MLREEVLPEEVKQVEASKKLKLKQMLEAGLKEGEVLLAEMKQEEVLNYPGSMPE